MPKPLAQAPVRLPEDFIALSDRVRRPEEEAARALIDRADSAKGYLHWEDFRQRPLPKGWTHEQLWALVLINRRGRPIEGLLDKAGSPFTLNRSDPLSAALHRIDTKEVLWRSLRPGGGVPEAPSSDVSYRLMAAIEEAHASSAIEGAVTTRRQARELLRSGRDPSTVSERMVWNSFRAIEHLDRWTARPLASELVLEMQALITDGLLAPGDCGHLRRDDDVRIVDELTGDVVFVPPPAAELPAPLEAQCAFANAPVSDETFVQPVTRAILLHHQLAYDHTFADGNGRTARLLFMWSVLRSGYHWFRSLSISRAVNRARNRYYRAFQEVQTAGGDVTYFVRQQVRCIELEIQHLADFLSKRASLEAWLESKQAIERELNTRQLALIEYALQQPDTIFTTREHRQFHGVTQPTAWKDLTDLVQRGLLTESKQGRKSLYSTSKRLRRLARERPGRSGGKQAAAGSGA
jgi:Fic family protein